MTPNLPQEKEEKPNGTTSRGSLSSLFTHTPRPAEEIAHYRIPKGGTRDLHPPPQKRRRGKEGSSSLLRGRDQKRSGGREKKPCHPAIIDGGKILTRLWW